jgi:hypothetical protein
MAIYNLNTVDEICDFYQETSFLGIISPVKDYKLCWLLNRHLGFDFTLNIEKEVVTMKKKRTYFFSVFDCFEASTWSHYDLYNNKYEGEFLLPEFKHIDFLWIIKGDSNFNYLLPAIKNIPEIQFTVNITLDMIKSKEQLIL